MNSEMLAAGGSLQVFSVSLQAFNISDSEPAGQIRIFTVGFMSAAPSGIPENIDIRAPYGQPLINIPVAETAFARASSETTEAISS